MDRSLTTCRDLPEKDFELIDEVNCLAEDNAKLNVQNNVMLHNQLLDNIQALNENNTNLMAELDRNNKMLELQRSVLINLRSELAETKEVLTHAAEINDKLKAELNRSNKMIDLQGSALIDQINEYNIQETENIMLRTCLKKAESQLAAMPTGPRRTDQPPKDGAEIKGV